MPTNNWGIAWIKRIQHFLILYRTYSSVVSRSTDLYFCILISLLPFHILYFLLWTKMSWGGFVICWSDGTTGSTASGSTANGAPPYIYKAEALFTSLNSMQHTCSGGNETTVFCEKLRRWGIKNKAKEDRSTKKLHSIMLVLPLHAIWLQIFICFNSLHFYMICPYHVHKNLRLKWNMRGRSTGRKVAFRR